jgi:hypothetical protein
MSILRQNIEAGSFNSGSCPNSQRYSDLTVKTWSVPVIVMKSTSAGAADSVQAVASESW